MPDWPATRKQEGRQSMTWKRKSPAKAERVVRRTKADGTAVEYRYPAYTPRPQAGDNVHALIDAYRRSQEWGGLSDQTRAGRTTYLKPLEHHGKWTVDKVRRRDIMEIRDAMLRMRGPGATNAFLAAATALFKWAVDREWIEHTPMLAIKRAETGSYRAWTRAEAEHAARTLPDYLRRVVLLARHTGQRRSDLCAMTWSAYDGASIRVVQQKTGVALVIPIAPALRAELDEWRRTATAVTILTNSHGRPWKPHTLSEMLPIALAKVGLPGDLNVHGLRKLAATELADAGCTPHEIAAITGHRTLQMVQHYTRSADQERLAGAAVLRLNRK
jgi:integrase